MIRWFETLKVSDVPLVGGKNASLGEMFSALKKKGVKVPEGFATTAEAYRAFVMQNGLQKEIAFQLDKLKTHKQTLTAAGKAIRRAILREHFSAEFLEKLKVAYMELGKRCKMSHPDVAVRSSATAEDLPDASFAGQQETFLNVRGIEGLVHACKECFASLFTDRAIAYREAKGFDHMDVSLSVGVQKMVRADKGASGVLFTLDPETGFPDVVVINAAYGLGENVVQGTISPDEYVVFKPFLSRKGIVPILEKKRGLKEKKMVYAAQNTRNVKTTLKEQASFALTDQEILQLSIWGKIIEAHYKKPMDIEWAKDGMTKELFIVQARPETVQSQKTGSGFKTYTLKRKGKRLLQGLAIGDAIATGRVQVIRSIREIHKFQEGAILVTGATSPDWVPIMQKAAGIITDQGGRTSHAAIVSRELGLPAIVGSRNGTEVLKNTSEVTLSCAEGDIGYVYEGKLLFDTKEIDVTHLPKTRTQIMLNVASPESAFRFWRLPAQGIGLARMEFIINNAIQIHPMALIHFDRVQEAKVKEKILQLTRFYKDKKEYFIDLLSQGIGRIAASQYPHPVIVRMSDFKTNEYANLIGGEFFELKEENPMLGFRGASRYYDERYREGFALECLAIQRVREKMGLKNVVVMIPFCRTLEEADRVLKEMAKHGLKKGKKDLKVYMMCEVPSNVILAEAFAKKFDGFSIGSNDLTQLTLGIDRDAATLAHLFDERNEAVQKMIEEVIRTAHRSHCKVGICGQGPSDYPDFATFLVKAGIDSLSLNPDSVVNTLLSVAKIEKKK